MDLQTGPVVRALGAMESLEQQLSCPICLDMFSKPVVILPCQHNLCRGCAHELYESKNPYHYSGGTFRCPTCRFEVVLDRHGVHGLQRNLLVENIIDMYKQQRESKGGVAEDPPLKDRDAPRCEAHADERINIYCVSCAAPTCSLCKVFGEHKDCEVAPLHAAYQTQKAELRAAVEQLAAANGRVQAAAAQADDACARIQENGERQRRRLGESLDLLFATLEESKGRLVERLDREQQRMLAALRLLQDQHRQQLQLCSRLQEKLQLHLQAGSAAHFLLAAKQLQEEAQAATENRLAGPEPGCDSMEHLSLDTKGAELLIASMDFRKGGEEDQ